jgi:hypothetical protein
VNIAGVEIMILNLGDGADHIQAGDLSSVADLATVRVDGGGATDSVTINGSSAREQYALDNTLAPAVRVVRAAPAPLTFEVRTVETLALNLAEGNDSVTIGTLLGVTGLTAITINCGADDDEMQVGDLTGVVDLATITIDGESGADSLLIAGSAGMDAFTATAVLGRLALQRTGPGMLTFSIATVELLTLNTAADRDTITIGDMTAVADLRTIRFDGGPGTDTLELTGSSAADIYAITNVAARLTVTTSNPGALTVDAGTVEGLMLNSGAEADIITIGNLAGLADLTDITINGEAGADRVVVDDLSGVNTLASVTINGGADVDSLTISGSPASDTFAADNARAPVLKLQRTTPGSLMFAISTVEALVLNTGGAEDRVTIGNLTGVIGLTSLTVNGGTEADVLDASALPPGVTALVLNGEGGPDTLTGSQGSDMLSGDDGNDIYVFDADLPSGTDTIIEAAAGGTDTINFSSSTPPIQQLNLGTAGTVQTVSANLSIILAQVNTIETAIYPPALAPAPAPAVLSGARDATSSGVRWGRWSPEVFQAIWGVPLLVDQFASAGTLVTHLNDQDLSRKPHRREVKATPLSHPETWIQASDRRGMGAARYAVPGTPDQFFGPAIFWNLPVDSPVQRSSERFCYEV